MISLLLVISSAHAERFGPSHMLFFTESALRPIQSISRDVRLSLCLFVGYTLENTPPEGLETSGRRAYR